MHRIRGVWLANVDSNIFDSRRNISEAMKILADAGFNFVFPVVWNQGFTLFPSSVMQKEFNNDQLGINPKYQGRDPLAEVIDEAHEHNLKVIPWFEYGFASSFKSNGGHIIEAKPEWAAKDRTNGLLKKNGFEWMNALDNNVQEFMLRLILEVVDNYQIEGIQGDDRLPALPSEGGYDSKTKQLYKDRFGTNILPSNTQDAIWLQFRADILTRFLEQLRAEVKRKKPELLISMAPSPHPFGYKEYLQDSPTWLEKNLVDMLHPQLYRRDKLAYQALVDDAVDRLFDRQHPERLYNTSPGVLVKVGEHNIDPQSLWTCIKHNRNNGMRGEVFFFYEGLRHNNDACIELLKQKKYSEFRILKRGFIGPDVKEVQVKLLAKGHLSGRTDGDFGPLTENAVKSFQQQEELSPVDGIVGPDTYAKLFPTDI